jgi:Family of unknown function (DUF6527)
MKVKTITPQYVEFIPKSLDDGVLYVSRKYRTAAHNCCCGCKTKIVTPLTPTDWELKENDSGVSLWPSIGNWNHPCQAHYIIKNNKVIRSRVMSENEIARGREYDIAAKESHYRESEIPSTTNITDNDPILARLFKKAMKWLGL